MDYQEKVITVKQALSLIKTNDIIVSGMVGAEAREILSHLHELDESVKNVSVTNCLPMLDADFFVKPEFAKRFNVDSWFLSGALRKGWSNGTTSFIPNHLHLAATARLDHVRPNIYIGCATPPDKHGFVSLSVSNVYEKRMIEEAGVVILELNPNFPRTFGDMELHISQVNYVIPVNYPVPEIPDQELTEKDIQIGNTIASYIKDGDCLQLGIGGIPNAVANALVNKRDLGVHTEMLTSGFMKLWNAGAISNKYKNINRGKMVCCFVAGPKALYDFVDNNPSILILDGRYVNDPYVIGQNDNQVSINATLEVDVTGQCCSESIGSRQWSGTGGQVDTVLGAQLSRGGRSFIALYSTAMVRNPVTGVKEEISTIVPQLKPGAVVTTGRNDVHYIVTEYGAVNLRGCSVRERVEKLISIAHPKFRDQIRKESIALGLLPAEH